MICSIIIESNQIVSSIRIALKWFKVSQWYFKISSDHKINPIWFYKLKHQIRFSSWSKWSDRPNEVIRKKWFKMWLEPIHSVYLLCLFILMNLETFRIVMTTTAEILWTGTQSRQLLLKESITCFPNAEYTK